MGAKRPGSLLVYIKLSVNIVEIYMCLKHRKMSNPERKIVGTEGVRWHFKNILTKYSMLVQYEYDLSI